MTDYERIHSMENLYRAHQASRRGKQGKNEVVLFEMNLAEELADLSEAIKRHTYRGDSYYHFNVYEPKKRSIHALRYRDRVVQHSLCDNVLMPLFEKYLIYDNAACRLGKGTDFAINRTKGFLQKHYRKFGSSGYVLKCDIKHYFENIDHNILKQKLERLIMDQDVKAFLWQIIDSYEDSAGKGLPLGNQSSQWFALYYLDGVDRLIKEKMGIKFYSRYMDDFLLLSEDKEKLKVCLAQIREFLEKELRLELNQKTQIYALRDGFEYLGFRFILTDTGKVLMRLKTQSKKRTKKRLAQLQKDYASGLADFELVTASIKNFRNHIMKGENYHLWRSILQNVRLARE